MQRPSAAESCVPAGERRGALVAALARRALTLGLWPMRVANDGSMVSPMFSDAGLFAWLTSPGSLGLARLVAGQNNTEALTWGGKAMVSGVASSVGETLAVAGFAPGFAGEAEYIRACVDAGVEPGAAAKLVKMTDLTAHRASVAALRLAAGDVTEIMSARRALDSCAAQLVAGMEAIDLLGYLGKSLHDFTQPSRLMTAACQRLQRTLGASWVSAWVDPASPAWEVAGRTVTLSGDPGEGEQTVQRHAAAWMKEVISPTRPVASLESGLGEGAVSRGQTIVVHRLARGTQAFGVLAVGLGNERTKPAGLAHLVSSVAGYLGAFIENAMLYREQQAMVLGSLRALCASIEAKDRTTSGHSARVAELAGALARAAGLDSTMVRRAHLCGLVHDIGKIGVPESVLLKPGPLDDQEMEHIRRHPRAGFDILRGLPSLEELLPGVLHHHERWDGRGYPTGLAGDDIPLLARIVGVADTFDAMSSARPYRPARSRGQVLGEIKSVAGRQLDPRLVDAMLSMDLGAYDDAVQRGEMARMA